MCVCVYVCVCACACVLVCLCVHVLVCLCVCSIRVCVYMRGGVGVWGCRVYMLVWFVLLILALCSIPCMLFDIVWLPEIDMSMVWNRSELTSEINQQWCCPLNHLYTKSFTSSTILVRYSPQQTFIILVCIVVVLCTIYIE